MRKSIYRALILTTFFACQTDSTSELQPTDLLEYGVPITIMAPDTIEVETRDMGGVMKDITITGGDNYSLQIYATDAETTDLSELKSQQIQEVKSNRFFSKIVEEEEAGFIYETQIDSNNINYGFRYIRVQGDKEYVFQTGMVGSFSRPDVERMYEAVKKPGR